MMIVFVRGREFYAGEGGTQLSFISKGAHLGGSRGACAPMLFLPCPKIIHIRAQIFLPRPEIIYISAPPLFSPVGRQCSFHYEIIYTW